AARPHLRPSAATALTPALRIGTQLRESLETGHDGSDDRVREVLREVALPDDDDFLARYPHELSGGQQQRVAIATAFIARPRLIVLDEPTTGLDVSTQEHVLQTVREMCSQYGCAAVYISHDMAVVAELSDRIAVMYSGRIVEIGSADEIIHAPRHPYTGRLLLAIPDLRARRPMVGIPGNAPSPLDRPRGCAFAPRCPLATDVCYTAPPGVEEISDGHQVRCYHWDRTLPPVDASTAQPGLTRDPEESPLVQIRGLKAGYGPVNVLEDIDVSVHRGECLALLGESGSGKTTLSRCIVGLHRKFSGEILLDGEPLP